MAPLLRRPHAAAGTLVAATAALSLALAPPGGLTAPTIAPVAHDAGVHEVVAHEAGAQKAVAYEAEAARLSQAAVDSDHAGHSGTGFVNFPAVRGAYAEFTVDSTQAGAATLELRYAGGTPANRPLDVTVNGTLAADSLAFPATGAWSSWKTVTTGATLEAGANTVRVTTAAADGPNLDRLTVTSTGPADTEKPTPPQSAARQGADGEQRLPRLGRGLRQHPRHRLRPLPARPVDEAGRREHARGHRRRPGPGDLVRLDGLRP